MTAVSPLSFPGSRTLAGWWKQFAPLQPRALWAGHLLLHRVEALASLNLLSPLEPLTFFVLKALSLGARVSLKELDQRLHLGPSLLRQLLRRLESEGLVQAHPQDTWALTEMGRQGLREGSRVHTRQERRAFYFVEPEQPARPCHYLNFVSPPAALPWPASDAWKFEPSQLHACVGKSPDWKRQVGFPLEVHHIMSGDSSPESAAHASEEWKRIILDRPERLALTLVLVPAGDRQERLLGFTVQPEGWILDGAEPALALENWREIFPELAVDLAMEDWRNAWRGWCHPRGLPAAEVDACVLERQGYRLRVRAGPRLVERLRAARSDVFKGEAWLLAGTGRLRTAAQIDLVELKRERIAPTPSGKT
jgi:DNA-binding MarR family transcriptional regulator